MLMFVVKMVMIYLRRRNNLRNRNPPRRPPTLLPHYPLRGRELDSAKQNMTYN